MLMRNISNMHWQLYVLFLLLEVCIPRQLLAQPTTNNEADNIYHAYQPREPLTQQKVLNVSAQGKQPSAQAYDLAMAQNMATEHTAGHKSHNKEEVDGDASKKIIGSSVVTSVSVILNGDEPEFTDALGHKIPKPQPSMPIQVASPIDLLNPDRYEFYTFDDNGDLVRRLMTLQEIQSIVANGDGEGPNIIHTAPIDDRDPEKNVQDIVYSVQNVLNKQVENTQNSNHTNKIPALDTPDVSSTWAMILPAIFGNTGGEIYPEQKPQQIAMTPDSELMETPTKATIEQSTKKPKPNKRKPGQKRKTTTTTTTTTTEITPQIVQEELASDETVYTGIKHYQHIAANVQDFQQFSNLHMQPIYHKLPESTTKHTYVNNEKLKKPIGSLVSTNNTDDKGNRPQSQTSKPNRTNATKRPRPPVQKKKPVAGQVQTTKAKPLKATTTLATPITTAAASNSTIATVTKKKKKKPARTPNPNSNSNSNAQKGSSAKPQHSSTTTTTTTTNTQKRKPSKPSKATTKPLNDQVTQSTELQQQTVQKTHHKTKLRPTKPAKTSTTTAASELLVSQIYTGLPPTPNFSPAAKLPVIATSTESQKYVSPGYPIPSFSLEQTAAAQSPAEEVVINQLKTQTFPSLSLLQQQYAQPQIDAALDSTQTEDDLKLSIGQIVQSLKQTTTQTGIQTDSVEQTLKPLGYDSAESLDKLEEMANKRKQPYQATTTTTTTTTTIKPEDIRTELLTTEPTEESSAIITTESNLELKINENNSNSNVIKFEPLLADVQEPIVMDLATTTEMTTEQESTTTIIKSEDLVATTTTDEADEVTTDSLVEKFLAAHLKVDTEAPPIIADLKLEYNLQQDAIPMSDLQTQAATVASQLIDGSVSTKTDMPNDDGNNRLTNIAQLNATFLLQATTTTTASTISKPIALENGQYINNLPLEEVEEDASINMESTTTYLADDVIETSTKISSDEFIEEAETEEDDELSSTTVTVAVTESPLELITLATETTTINSLVEELKEVEKEQEEIQYNSAGSSTMEFSMDTTTTTSQFEENGIENKIEAATNTTLPIKLNKSEQSSVEEFFEYNGTKASDEQEDMATSDITTVIVPLDNKEIEIETETESSSIEVAGGIKVKVDSSSKIKVNDAGTQKEVNKQEPELSATEYAFVTETSADTSNKLNDDENNDDVNETTENVQIFSAINNNSQDAEMAENESENGTETETTTNAYVDIQTTNTVDYTTLPTNIAKEDSYVKLGELPFKDTTIDTTEKPDDDDEDEDDQTTTTPTTTSTTTTTVASVSTTTQKQLSTLKPVSYYKQPTFGNYLQPEFPKPVTYISAQRPMQRPAALTNLMATSTAATRPPVRLDPSPSHSKGLEASTLGLDADVLEFAKLCNELAFNYWKSITSEKVSSARSLVLSPFALTSMLSMVFLGARGSTSGEMNEILKLDDMVTFNPHLIFKNITDSVERSIHNDIATTAFVRLIFSDRANGRILPFFKEKTQQFYAGHVEEVNFHVVNDIIRRRTNLLVKRHTLGKVQEYLRTNSVWVNGPLATISANLFQTDCSQASTAQRDGELFFQVHPTVRQRRLVPIPAVLYKTGFTAGYDTKLDATVVAFGRIQDIVSTIYVMPGLQNTMSLTDNLEHLESQLMELAFKENAWSNLLTTLMDRPGLEVQLPRFSHRSFVNASLGLQKMGLKGLFKSEFADLRGLTGSANHDVFLSDMIQINTFSTCGEERIADNHHVEMYPAPPLRKRNKDMEANEDDTLDSSEAIIDFGSLVHESALARSFYDDLLDPKYLELPLPLRPRQARVPDAPPRLRFDKPFLYFVRHNPTGIILFMGRFNPRLLP